MGRSITNQSVDAFRIVLILGSALALGVSGCRLPGQSGRLTHSLDANRQSGADEQIRIAQRQLELGQTALARQSAEHAVDLDPKSAAAWAMRGRATHAIGQAQAALADFHRALALAPDDRTILWEIADLYRELGRPQRALAAFSSLAGTYAPGEQPQRLLYSQGLAYTALGRYDDAVDVLSAAVIRQQPTAEIFYRLAEAQMLAGRAHHAATSAREALALDPRHEPSLRLLGRTELALGPAGAIR